jgi:hypothetical protein
MKMEPNLSHKALIYYWQDLDNNYQVLIDTVCDDAKSLDGKWYKTIFQAMCSAFRHACPTETPRQIQAYAKAEAFLNLKPIESKNLN